MREKYSKTSFAIVYAYLIVPRMIDELCIIYKTFITQLCDCLTLSRTMGYLDKCSPSVTLDTTLIRLEEY